VSPAEAKEILARYLSGTAIAKEWDKSGLSEARWLKLKAELEDVLMGEFELSVKLGYVNGDQAWTRWRLFQYSDYGTGTGPGSDLLIDVRPRARVPE
jgi:hypothetical protein